MTPGGEMQYVKLDGFGGPEVLKADRMAVPQAGEGEILIKVAAAGVNRPDVQQRLGQYNPPPGASQVPGLEISGEVVARGEGANRYKVGDQVCALVSGGGYAEYMRGTGTAGLAGAGRRVPGRCRRHSGNVFHGVDKCVRARRAQAGRNAAHSWRFEWNRHDRHPTRARVRLAGVRHRGQRREMRRLCRSRRGTGDQLSRRGFPGGC